MIHMLKERTGSEVVTRCRKKLPIRSGQALPDIGVTGSERNVSCPDCRQREISD